MRCESYNANKFNIMFHVCSLVVMSESPQKLSCSENASKLATRNQTRSLRNYSKDLGDALHSSKINVGSCQNHPTRPYTGNKWKTYQNRTLPKKEFFGGKWREYGRNKRKYGRLWKSLQERARLNTSYYFVGFPKRRNYSRGIGDAWHPSKTQVGSCYNHKAPKIGKKKTISGDKAPITEATFHF